MPWGDGLKVIHDGFRHELALIRAEAAASGAGVGARLRADCLAVCAMLHGHHTVEDDRMLPVVDEHHPELAAATASLREEHAAMQVLLDELQDLLSGDSVAPADLERRVGALTAQVEAHLDYEEETLIPVLNALAPNGLAGPS